MKYFCTRPMASMASAVASHASTVGCGGIGNQFYLSTLYAVSIKSSISWLRIHFKMALRAFRCAIITAWLAVKTFNEEILYVNPFSVLLIVFVP